MEAKRGDYIKVTSDYYKYLKGNVYQVINAEPCGVFIKDYGYIILHSDYEIVEK